MEELLKTNDLVLISFVEAILKEIDAGYFIADTAISALEGSIGILPRRIMIVSEDAPRARRALADAGLATELADPPRRGFFPW